MKEQNKSHQKIMISDTERAHEKTYVVFHRTSAAIMLPHLMLRLS